VETECSIFNNITTVTRVAFIWGLQAERRLHLRFWNCMGREIVLLLVPIIFPQL